MYLKLLCILSAIAYTTAVTADLPATISGKVKANVLNVRVNPGTAFTVVARLNAGDDVAVLRKQGDWYEILAPRDAVVWVAAEFLQDGKSISNLKLRSGPSVNHRPYGVAPAGTPLTALGERQGGWIRVAPPPFLTAWVSSEHVECDAAALEARQQPATASPVPSDSPETIEAQIESSPVSEYDAPHDRTPDGQAAPVETSPSPLLPFVEGTEKDVVLKGVVYPLKAGAVYVTHALVEVEDDDIKVLCYLHGGDNTLKVWEQRRITVTGQQKLVNGWRFPVVEVDKISTDW